jgi:signal transduction histidine kinase
VVISAKLLPDDMVQLTVKDTGIGMSPEILDKLFFLNDKGNRKGTDGELSTGLGLIICKDLVEKCGGKIWVKSKEAKGSTFSLSLPHNPQTI